MRMFHRAAALPLAILLLTTFPTLAAPAGEPAAQSGAATPSSTPPLPSQNPARRLAELRSRLGEMDQIVAMRALHMALTQVPDGGTFIWRKRSLSLKGMIRPSKAFRNADGQICRHVIYALALGRYSKQIEGIACRRDDGRWQL